MLPNIRSLLVISDETPDAATIKDHYSRQGSQIISVKDAIANTFTKLPFHAISVFSIRDNPLPDFDTILGNLSNRLLPRGILNYHVVINPEAATVDAVKEKLSISSLLTGLVDGEFTKEKLNGANETVFQFVAQKPSWRDGSASKIGESDELIDDNEVDDPLAEFRPKVVGKRDCSSKKKACANCTCGRKEAEAGLEKSAKASVVQSEGCGSCYLGDAFRCSTCPYAGKPAFKPGDKIKLDNLNSVPDIMRTEEGETLVKGLSKISV